MNRCQLTVLVPLFSNRIKQQMLFFDSHKIKMVIFFYFKLHDSKYRHYFKCNILLSITGLIPKKI